jgi:hypothetical protein
MPNEDIKDAPVAEPAKATKPAKDAPVAEPAAPRNLTRESLELVLASRFEGEGKSAGEAKKLAAKRALEIVPD